MTRMDGVCFFFWKVQFVYEIDFFCIFNMKFAENTHGISNVISQSSKDFSSEVLVSDKTGITVRANENCYQLSMFHHLNLVHIFNGRHCNPNFATKKNWKFSHRKLNTVDTPKFTKTKPTKFFSPPKFYNPPRNRVTRSPCAPQSDFLNHFVWAQFSYNTKIFIFQTFPSMVWPQSGSPNAELYSSPWGGRGSSGWGGPRSWYGGPDIGSRWWPGGSIPGPGSRGRSGGGPGAYMSWGGGGP